MPALAPPSRNTWPRGTRGSGRRCLALSTITLADVLIGPHQAGQTALAKRDEKALCQFEVAPVTVPITALEIGASAFVTHDREFSGVTALPVLMGE